MMRSMPWLVRKINHFQPSLSKVETMWAVERDTINRVTTTLYGNQTDHTPEKNGCMYIN